MNARTPAPRGLKWVGGTFGTVVAYAIAIASIVLSGYVLSLYKDLAGCIADGQARDQRRAAVLSPFTDRERAADRALLVGPVPGGPDGHALRQIDLDARAATDRARAANPVPPVPSCR
jgi:hypothetical protein